LIRSTKNKPKRVAAGSRESMGRVRRCRGVGGNNKSKQSQREAQLMASTSWSMLLQSIGIKPKKGSCRLWQRVGCGREIICHSSLQHSKYGGTRGQIKISAKSDGMHLSEVRRVHFDIKGPH